MEKTMVLMIGIPASGKSTFYQNKLAKDFVRVNLDTLKTRERENELIDKCFSEGKSFVIDDTNVTRSLRQGFIAWALYHRYHVVGYFMRSRVKECVSRNRQRTGDARVPDTAIANMSNKLQQPRWDEGFDKLYYVEIKDGDYVISEWRKDK